MKLIKITKIALLAATSLMFMHALADTRINQSGLWWLMDLVVRQIFRQELQH